MKTGSQQVAAYIAAAPARARPLLRQLRRIVKTSAPGAEERLSYRMPYYAYHGRLAYFAAFRNHVSFFVMVRDKRAFVEQMKPYRVSPSTLRFAFDRPIPASLVKRLVKARVRELEAAKAR